ncbi:cardiolipin synthase [Tissierella creatinophila]|uniref:Cardiolipin synthase n=1 Tax=Tissierella creatinophila DSM 6911 TaxID=1123403 RepID=A0A1U7M411_TISCR|nr:cardiolipin synthase [Tissierella creatinophila]OLS02053.1 major cardiolipin synthase ClsA [Tissierella creatinophila DSM 6911]
MKNIVDNYLLLTSNLLWINIILAFLLIIFERKNPTSTWLWIMVLTFLPIVGFVLYLFIGQDLSRQRIFKVKKEEDSYFRNLAIKQKKQINNGKLMLKNPNIYIYEDLIKMQLMNSEAYYTEDNNVELYFSGKEKFKALLESIESAENYIHIEYYIFKSDGIGTEVIDALKKKALEGVKVKLLIDGMGGRKINKRERKSIIDSGIELAVFFPPFVPLLNVRINYRNHRKICIVDGKEAFMGGFNIGDEYLGRSKRFGNWRDTHIKIKGSAVSSLQWRFFLDWRFAAKEEINACQSFLHEADTKDNVGIQIVSSGPDSKWPSIKDGYMKMISDARDKLYIETPYFIPDESIFEALRLAGLSGVDVRIMIPNKPDHPFIYWASMSYVGELLEAGVKVYTYENGFLHSKVLIADEFVSSVGTANLDIRSFRLNFEVNAFIYDEDVNIKLTERFLEDLNLCKEITIQSYGKRSRYIKFKESISRLLSPIL